MGHTSVRLEHGVARIPHGIIAAGIAPQDSLAVVVAAAIGAVVFVVVLVD